MFLDVETGRELYIDPDQARQQYQAKFTAHARALKEICQRLGVDLYDLPTNKPLEHALFDLIQSRMRRGRLIARHRGGSR